MLRSIHANFIAKTLTSATVITRRLLSTHGPFRLPCYWDYHPESRRTEPEVYALGFVNRAVNEESPIYAKRRLKRVYGRYLSAHPAQPEYQRFTEHHRWAEFRRRMIYSS